MLDKIDAMSEARGLGLHPVDPSHPEGRWGSLAADQSWPSVEEAVQGYKALPSPSVSAEGIHSNHSHAVVGDFEVEEGISLLSAASFTYLSLSETARETPAAKTLASARKKLMGMLGIPLSLMEEVEGKVRQKVAGNQENLARQEGVG